MQYQDHAGSTGQAHTIALPAGLQFPLEVRVHGRGGQGGVTCAKLIATLYSQMGLQVQTFGDYGSERSGAPVQAYTRVDRVAINNRNKVYQPDHLIVLDEGLIGPQVLAGAAPGAMLLLNTRRRAGPLSPRVSRSYRLGMVDATAIAREHGIGSDAVVIVNTTILGAYARLLGVPLGGAGNGVRLARPGRRPRRRGARLRGSADARCRRARWSGSHCSGAHRAAAGRPGDRAHRGLSADAQDRQLELADAAATRTMRHPAIAACPAGNDVVGFVQALNNERRRGGGGDPPAHSAAPLGVRPGLSGALHAVMQPRGIRRRDEHPQRWSAGLPITRGRHRLRKPRSGAGASPWSAADRPD